MSKITPHRASAARYPFILGSLILAATMLGEAHAGDRAARPWSFEPWVDNIWLGMSWLDVDAELQEKQRTAYYYYEPISDTETSRIIGYRAASTRLAWCEKRLQCDDRLRILTNDAHQVWSIAKVMRITGFASRDKARAQAKNLLAQLLSMYGRTTRRRAPLPSHPERDDAEVHLAFDKSGNELPLASCVDENGPTIPYHGVEPITFPSGCAYEIRYSVAVDNVRDRKTFDVTMHVAFRDLAVAAVTDTFPTVREREQLRIKVTF
jgi:hypothetical protein